MKTLNELKEIAEKIKSDERYVDMTEDGWVLGLRVLDEDYDDYNAKVGYTLSPSYQWVDGEFTDNVLNGACALDVFEKMNKWYGSDHSGYSGDKVVLIGGKRAESGDDLGEIIIKDAVVLEIL